jgi:hypothetical protein
MIPYRYKILKMCWQRKTGPYVVKTIFLFCPVLSISYTELTWFSKLSLSLFSFYRLWACLILWQKLSFPLSNVQPRKRNVSIFLFFSRPCKANFFYQTIRCLIFSQTIGFSIFLSENWSCLSFLRPKFGYARICYFWASLIQRILLRIRSGSGSWSFLYFKIDITKFLRMHISPLFHK